MHEKQRAESYFRSFSPLFFLSLTNIRADGIMPHCLPKSNTFTG